MTSPVSVIADPYNGDIQKFLEPVTPTSSDGERSSSPPAYSGYHYQGYDLSDSLFQQNNNYVPYEEIGLQRDQKPQNLPSYPSSVFYETQTSTKPQLPRYQENQPPRESQPQRQMSCSQTPSPTKTIRPHAYHSGTASESFSAYSTELYKPYEDTVAVLNGVGGLTDRASLQQQNSDYQPSTTTINSTQPLGSSSQKRARTQFTSIQLVEMEREFTEGRYLSRAKRINLAQKLTLTEKQIKVWFQNRRMKFNRDNKMNRNVKQCKALSPESSHSSSVGSPGMDSSRILRHSPIINNSGAYQGFSSTQWHDPMYPASSYPHQSIYNAASTAPPDTSNYPGYSSYYSSYPPSCYPNSASPYVTGFSAGLAPPVRVPEPLKKEEFVSQSSHEYTPNVTVSWGPTGSMIELQELK